MEFISRLPLHEEYFKSCARNILATCTSSRFSTARTIETSSSSEYKTGRSGKSSSIATNEYETASDEGTDEDTETEGSSIHDTSIEDCDDDWTSVDSCSHHGVLDSPSRTSKEKESPIWKCPYDIIPQFFQLGKKNCVFNQSIEEDSFAIKHPEIKSIFQQYSQRCLPWKDFATLIVRPWLHLPVFTTKLIISKMNALYLQSRSQQHVNQGEGLSNDVVHYKVFAHYWEHEIAPFDPIERLFRLLYKCNVETEGSATAANTIPLGTCCCEGLTADDFIPLIQEIIDVHPGLREISCNQQKLIHQQSPISSKNKKLSAANALPAFDEKELLSKQNKYMLSVITRIFYQLNRSRTGVISIREFRYNGGKQFLNVLISLSTMWDINEETSFFSIEHFHTLVHLFQSLDEDSQDGVLTRRELQKYDNFALTPAIINRIFQVGERAFTDGELGFKEISLFTGLSGMSFSDFIYFFLSEIDKGTIMATKYWYRCYDIDNCGFDCSSNGEGLSEIVLRQMYQQQYARFQSIYPSTPLNSHNYSNRSPNKPKSPVGCVEIADKYSFNAVLKVTLDSIQSSIHAHDSHSLCSPIVQVQTSSTHVLPAFPLTLSTLLQVVSISSSTCNCDNQHFDSLAIRKDSMINFWNGMFNLRQYTLWDQRCSSSGFQPSVRSTIASSHLSLSSCSTVDERCWSRFIKMYYAATAASCHSKLRNSTTTQEFYLHEDTDEYDEEDSRDNNTDDCDFTFDLDDNAKSTDDDGMFF